MPQPAPMQDEDVFAEFRNQFRAAKDPAAKKALMQQLEDAMYEQMRTHLQPEYDEMDTLDQPPAAPAQVGLKPAAPTPAPQSFRPVIDEPPGHAADDMEPDGDMDDEEAIGGVPLRNVGPMGPPDDEEAFSDPNRGRIQFDKSGGVARTGDGYVDEEDPNQPPYTFPLPKGSMRGKPYPREREFGGGDTLYSNFYRWDKDNGAPEPDNDQGPSAFKDDGAGYNKFVDDYEMKRTGGREKKFDEADFANFVQSQLDTDAQGAGDWIQEADDADYERMMDNYMRSKGQANGRQAMAGDDAMPPGGKTGMFGRY